MLHSSFNGGVEAPAPKEDRILVPSPKVPTYDLRPEMERTGSHLTGSCTDCGRKIRLYHFEFCQCGYGRTHRHYLGVVSWKGVRVSSTGISGNADCMIDEEGNAVTAHSLSPVPLGHIASDPKELSDGGRLCDIAPTLLDLMGLEKPAEMTGKKPGKITAPSLKTH